jgi:two-component system NarL family sensor kinase
MRKHAGASASLVVEDTTKAPRSERMRRGLSRRLLQAQEVEREHVALELHDHITQALCSILIRLEIMTGNLPAQATESREEAAVISGLVEEAAENVERISSRLRPSVLGILGLIPALRGAITGFVKRTGLDLKLACGRLHGRVTAEAELALFRILEEALQNVERHAHARHVTVQLEQTGAFMQLTIRDDGVGFETKRGPARGKVRGAFGLLGLEERATSVGGSVRIKSAPLAGTQIVVRIPLVKAPEPVNAGRAGSALQLPFPPAHSR